MAGISYAGQNALYGGYGGYNPYAAQSYGMGAASAVSGLQNRQLDLQEKELADLKAERERAYQTMLYEMGAGSPEERSEWLGTMSGGSLTREPKVGPKIGPYQVGSAGVSDLYNMLRVADQAKNLGQRANLDRFGATPGFMLSPSTEYDDISRNLTKMARGLTRG